ncbi:hypothetical protein B0J11DRAFT_508211 [Dendryphion nanum]|uniref:Uncharacterized protein n=1 Tax=Dendryphion nanum TaxID=256645 RepID=A0A9P9IHV8_9PLEO|nr:hypothetical protein B0J11DRAFT_508211 [Dendryphion nanum]
MTCGDKRDNCRELFQRVVTTTSRRTRSSPGNNRKLAVIREVGVGEERRQYECHLPMGRVLLSRYMDGIAYSGRDTLGWREFATRDLVITDAPELIDESIARITPEKIDFCSHLPTMHDMMAALNKMRGCVLHERSVSSSCFGSAVRGRSQQPWKTNLGVLDVNVIGNLAFSGNFIDTGVRQRTFIHASALGPRPAAGQPDVGHVYCVPVGSRRLS